MHDTYDKGEHIKEVFAYFGRAFYMANVFETGLAIAILQLDFLSGVMNRLKKEGRKGFDRSVYEVEFDAFMDQHHAQTLGNLFKRVQGLVEIDSSLKNSILELKKRRDYLAHHFFRDRAIELISKLGRDQMIAELGEAHTLFEAADHNLSEFMKPYRERLGFSDEYVDAETRRLVKEHNLDDDP